MYVCTSDNYLALVLFLLNSTFTDQPGFSFCPEDCVSKRGSREGTECCCKVSHSPSEGGGRRGRIRCWVAAEQVTGLAAGLGPGGQWGEDNDWWKKPEPQSQFLPEIIQTTDFLLPVQETHCMATGKPDSHSQTGRETFKICSRYLLFPVFVFP